MKNLRTDHLIISNIVASNSRVLDIGCADGRLLHILEKKKMVSGQGIEINHKKVEKCLERGLSVVEGHIITTSLRDPGRGSPPRKLDSLAHPG